MIVKHEAEARPADLSAETDLKGVELLPLLTEADGATHFSMRLFRLSPGGYTPLHTHPWEHEVFVVRGSGEVIGENGAGHLEAGTAVLVAAGELHRFRAGENGMIFICCIPNLPKG